MDGFDARKSVVIGATNRKADLDAALLSRFDTVVTFGLPDASERYQILRRYARHLAEAQLLSLAETTADLSGRDFRDVAAQAERRWASKVNGMEVGFVLWCGVLSTVGVSCCLQYRYCFHAVT